MLLVATPRPCAHAWIEVLAGAAEHVSFGAVRVVPVSTSACQIELRLEFAVFVCMTIRENVTAPAFAVQVSCVAAVPPDVENTKIIRRRASAAPIAISENV